MTEVREPNFTLDLPGEWERVTCDEPATYVYRETGGRDTVTVSLLAVRSMFTIADPKQLLSDYLHHRPKFELAKNAGLLQSPAFQSDSADAPEGGWDAVDAAAGRRLRHRVMLSGNLLADFVFEGWEADESTSVAKANEALGSATICAG